MSTTRKGFAGDERVLDELREQEGFLTDPDNVHRINVRGTDTPDTAEGSISFAIQKGRLAIKGDVIVQIGEMPDTGKRRRETDK